MYSRSLSLPFGNDTLSRFTLRNLVFSISWEEMQVSVRSSKFIADYRLDSKLACLRKRKYETTNADLTNGIFLLMPHPPKENECVLTTLPEISINKSGERKYDKK